MTIKEVEERTGLTRSNIRFYEKEKLIQPIRNESNGYREYTEKDVEDIKKIAYPLTCIIIRLFFRPCLRNKLQIYTWCYGEMITDYMTNFFCFVILSVEVFTVLYIYGVVKHVTTLLLIDSAVFLGLLILGISCLTSGKMNGEYLDYPEKLK